MASSPSVAAAAVVGAKDGESSCISQCRPERTVLTKEDAKHFVDAVAKSRNDDASRDDSRVSALDMALRRMRNDVETLARTHRDHLIHRFDCWAADLLAARDVCNGDAKVQCQQTDVARNETEPLSVYRAQTPPPGPTTLGAKRGSFTVSSILPSWTSPRVTPLVSVESIRCERSNSRELSSACAGSSPVLINTHVKQDAGAVLPGSFPTQVSSRTSWSMPAHGDSVPTLLERTDEGDEKDAMIHTLVSCSAKRKAHEDHVRNLKRTSSQKFKFDKKHADDYISAHTRKHKEAYESKLQEVTTSQMYERIMLVAIVLNAAFVGFEVQHLALQAMSQPKLPQHHENPAFLVGHTVFFVVFLADLLLRWYADGLVMFFHLQDRRWNFFDLFVVAMSLVELVLDLVEVFGIAEIEIHGIANVSVLRVLRVIRVVRLLRVIKVVRFFRELRMMLHSLVGSVKQLLWVMVVFALIFYMFGIMFTWAVFQHCRTGSNCVDSDQDLIRYFGTLDRSALTLFMSISGGKDWGDYYEVMQDLSTMTKSLYMLYMSFAIVAAMNVVTGIFVECAMRTSEKDREFVIQEELHEKEKYVSAMDQVFHEIDVGSSGNITFDEFEKHLADDRAVAYFAAMDIDCDDAKTLFCLLDSDGSGLLDFTEFLEGCEKLKGDARTIDLAVLRFEVLGLLRIITETLEELREDMGQKADKKTPPREASQLDDSADPTLPILLT
eukprot:TRINITY_DN4102_c0_g1_i1.p1 TRINITY_DN4102_c0_g1~~TRINITY_DN4102_c0_g1_i1.p1  ORF type:complete len:723 (-),score=118.73 TRINITY_DN4102_c0_g1_i1:59-2227(-)